MNNINKFIEKVISEAALDNRVVNGIIDLNNPEHVRVVAETMYDSYEDEQLVNEFVEQFMEEGKYPDRQAFNKDGWLVTFPSKDYRDRAIKKGTHSISDPTHGRGGMNLYYKRKGKQKRQTQQQATITKDVDGATKSLQASQPTQSKGADASPSQSIKTPDFSDTEKRTSRLAKLTGKPNTDSKTAPENAPASTGGEKSQPSSPTQSDPITTAPEKPSSPPQVDSPKPDYEEISKKFVTQKRWMPTEFGEYRDTQGNTVAVVGLSGEIVPVRNTDREEYKLFAEKNMPQQ